MARGATSFVTEQLLAPRCGLMIEASSRRLWRLQAELVIEQCRQFRCHQVGRLLNEYTKSLITEVAMPAHLSDADIRIPVGNRTVTCDSFKPDASQAVDRRDDNRERGSVQRDDAGAIDIMMSRVVLAGSPRPEFRLRRGP